MKRTGKIEGLWQQWHHFNRRFFGGKLKPPRVIRITRARRYDGYICFPDLDNRHTWPCAIYLSSLLSRADMSGILLHEMIHQYQWEVLQLEDPNDHGITFRGMAKQIERSTRFVVRVKGLDPKRKDPLPVAR